MTEQADEAVERRAVAKAAKRRGSRGRDLGLGVFGGLQQCRGGPSIPQPSEQIGASVTRKLEYLRRNTAS